MMDEVKIERVRGGYIISYYDEDGRHIREVHTLRAAAVRALASILTLMDGKQSRL